ncbi:RRP46 [Sanghuangporus weigelae]
MAVCVPKFPGLVVVIIYHLPFTSMDFKRPDGRLPNELRDIIISFDGLDGVDGSARFGFGDTKALASVSGPMEVRLAVEQANKATFEVLVRPLSGLPGTDSKALASALRNALLPSMILTTNPRTLVQLVALSLTPIPIPPPRHANLYSSLDDSTKRRRKMNASILRTSPALVAALINASSLALLNAASVPLRGVVCACSVGRVRPSSSSSDPDESVLIVDPSSNELSLLDGAGTFAFLIAGDNSSAASGLDAKLVWSHWNATPFNEDELARATELARTGAFRVRGHMRGAIERALSGLQASGSQSTDSISGRKDVKAKIKQEDLDDAKMEI